MFRIAKHSVELSQQASFLIAYEPEPSPTVPAETPGPVLQEEAIVPPAAEEEKEAPIMLEEPMPDIEGMVREAIEEANARVDTILREAEAAASQMLARAEAENAVLREKAYQEAREEGRVKGEQEALEEGRAREEQSLRKLLDEEKESFASWMSELSDKSQDIFSAMERHVLQLSLAIGEKIVGAVIDRDDGVFPQMVRTAVEQIKSVGKILVYVSAEDYMKYYASNSFTMELADETVRVSVVEDASLPRGSCIVETPDEMIDASIRTQLSIIRDTFHQGSSERAKGIS